MKRLVSMVAVSGVMCSLAGVVAAQPYANIHETQCREEMNLIGVELQPGPQKDSLRQCIREKVVAEREAVEQSRTKRANVREQNDILKQTLQRQQNVIPQDGLGSSVQRTQFEQECREHLHIGRNQILHPGPLKGSLERCVERKTSEFNRINDAKRHRSSVQQKQETLLEQTLQKQQELLQEELLKRSELHRTRIETQTKVSPRQLREVAKPSRAQPYYSTERKDNDATRRDDAEKCRGVPPAEWGACIHDALNSTDE